MDTSIKIDTSMYYTFSTIAQVLAGFIALSGVFIIFKTQEIKKIVLLELKSFAPLINKELSVFRDGYRFEILHECDELSKAIKMENMSEVSRKIKIILKDKSFEKTYSELAKVIIPNATFVENLNQIVEKLLKLTKVSVTIGVVTILFSLCILPQIHSIGDCWLKSFSIIAIMGAFLSIAILTLVILMSLKDIPSNVYK